MTQQSSALFIFIVTIVTSGKYILFEFLKCNQTKMNKKKINYFYSFHGQFCQCEMQSRFRKHRTMVFFILSWEQIVVRLHWDLQESRWQHGFNGRIQEDRDATKTYERLCMYIYIYRYIYIYIYNLFLISIYYASCKVYFLQWYMYLHIPSNLKFFPLNIVQ